MQGFAAQTDRYVGMDLVDPAIDFVALARSLGIAAQRATRLADAVDLLKTALSAASPSLIEVELDRSYASV